MSMSVHPLLTLAALGAVWTALDEENCWMLARPVCHYFLRNSRHAQPTRPLSGFVQAVLRLGGRLPAWLSSLCPHRAHRPSSLMMTYLLSVSGISCEYPYG